VLERKHCFIEPFTKPYSHNTACLLEFSHNCKFIRLGAKTFVAVCMCDVYAQIFLENHLKRFRRDAYNHFSVTSNVSSEIIHRVLCRLFVMQKNLLEFFFTIDILLISRKLKYREIDL
jgi:hypothetical protein